MLGMLCFDEISLKKKKVKKIDMYICLKPLRCSSYFLKASPSTV